MAGSKGEDPNKPFSVARVAVWALGIISLVSVIGLIMVAVMGDTDPQASASLRSVAQTSIGALAAVAAARVGGK